LYWKRATGATKLTTVSLAAEITEKSAPSLCIPDSGHIFEPISRMSLTNSSSSKPHPDAFVSHLAATRFAVPSGIWMAIPSLFSLYLLKGVQGLEEAVGQRNNNDDLRMRLTVPPDVTANIMIDLNQLRVISTESSPPLFKKSDWCAGSDWAVAGVTVNRPPHFDGTTTSKARRSIPIENIVWTSTFDCAGIVGWQWINK
jgi:hypothetical protein